MKGWSITYTYTHTHSHTCTHNTCCVCDAVASDIQTYSYTPERVLVRCRIRMSVWVSAFAIESLRHYLRDVNYTKLSLEYDNKANCISCSSRYQKWTSAAYQTERCACVCVYLCICVCVYLCIVCERICVWAHLYRDDTYVHIIDTYTRAPGSMRGNVEYVMHTFLSYTALYLLHRMYLFLGCLFDTSGSCALSPRWKRLFGSVRSSP